MITVFIITDVLRMSILFLKFYKNYDNTLNIVDVRILHGYNDTNRFADIISLISTRIGGKYE